MYVCSWTLPGLHDADARSRRQSRRRDSTDLAEDIGVQKWKSSRSKYGDEELRPNCVASTGVNVVLICQSLSRRRRFLLLAYSHGHVISRHPFHSKWIHLFFNTIAPTKKTTVDLCCILIHFRNMWLELLIGSSLRLALLVSEPERRLTLRVNSPLHSIPIPFVHTLDRCK
jgi:hypothetical protein